MNEQPSLLKILEQPENRFLANEFIHRKLLDGQFLYDVRDTQDDCVFVVTAGRLRVFLTYEGKEFTLFFLEPGDLYTLHTGAMVEAKKGAEIRTCDMATFRRLLVAYPALSLTVMPILTDLLRNTMRIIEDLTFHDVKYRLIRVLCDAAASRGKPSPEGILIETDMNTEDFAMQVGATRQSISAVFNQLMRSGCIGRVNRNLMLIPDLERLKKEAASC